MADTLPFNFPLPSENVIASYNFTDIMSGTAFQEFDIAQTINNSTTSYILTSNNFKSHSIEQGVTVPINTAAYTKLSDLDYDIEVLIPRVIKGEAIINTNIKVASVAGQPVSGYLIFKVRKYSNSSESEIASGQSATLSLSGSGVFQQNAIDITIPKTSFTVGDILRLTVEVWARNTAGGNAGYIYYGVDPAERTDATYTSGESTRTIFYCPFEVVL